MKEAILPNNCDLIARYTHIRVCVCLHVWCVSTCVYVSVCLSLCVLGVFVRACVFPCTVCVSTCEYVRVCIHACMSPCVVCV